MTSDNEYAELLERLRYDLAPKPELAPELPDIRSVADWTNVYIKNGETYEKWTAIEGKWIRQDLEVCMTTNFYLEVAKGNVKGHSAINKFGHNPTAVAGDDIWGGGGTYPFYPTAGVDVDAVSTSVNDTNGGTGANQLVVIGLDINWNPIEETVTMNGTSVVQLTTKFIRMFRAFVRIAGTLETNDGNITVYARSAGSGLAIGAVGIYIGAGRGQTQQCIYTVPAGKSAYFVKGYVGLKNSTFQGEDGVFNWLLKVNAFGPGGAWLIQGEAGLVNIGSSYWQYEYGVPAGPIVEKTDIRITLTEASATMDTIGGFDLILVDN